jgi:hypothetical protein
MQHEFESLESAQDFVALLAETVAEAKRELEADVQREPDLSRRQDALRIALYSLSKLELHVSRTSRILNDLRSLRRLLFEERREASHTANRGLQQARQPHRDVTKSPARLDESVAA